MGIIGPLLQNALLRTDGNLVAGSIKTMSAEVHIGLAEPDAGLPVVVKAKDVDPREHEDWSTYKERVGEVLHELNETTNGGIGTLLFSANAIAAQYDPEQAVELANHPQVSLVELDPLVNPLLMDDAIQDVAVARFREERGDLDGAGIRVAVLDSGVDTLRRPRGDEAAPADLRAGWRNRQYCGELRERSGERCGRGASFRARGGEGELGRSAGAHRYFRDRGDPAAPGAP